MKKIRTHPSTRHRMSGLFAGIMTVIAAGHAHSETILLTAARAIDPASGQTIEGPAFLIDAGAIVQRGTLAAMTVPEGTKTIDLGDKTILPGLIDMHTHLLSPARKGRGYDGLQYGAERYLLWGVGHAEKTLLAGFTTVRNVGSPTLAITGFRDAINAGDIVGPRMFVAGPPVGIIGGHCSDENYLPHDEERSGENTATGPWEMRARVRRNIKFGVDLIKTCSTGGVFSKGTLLGAPQSTVEELRAIVDEAHMRGLKVAAHAHGTIGIKNAIEAGIDTIEHASFLDDEAIRMAKRAGTYLSMDIYNTEFTLAEGETLGVPEESLNKEREVGEIQRESFRKAVESGALVIFGSDSGIYPHGDNGKQFARMVRFGMTPMQAIRAATSLAADALGQKGTVGCIDQGCAADLIAVDANPLDDISALETVSFVMKEGVVYKE